MSKPMKKTSCQINCVLVGAVIGFLAFVMLSVLGDWSLLQAIFGGGVIFVVALIALLVFLCKPLTPLREIQQQQARAAHPEASQPAPTPAAPVADTSLSAATTAMPAAAPETALPEAADAGEGVKPQTLQAARNGQADDLKQIRGVGPKLETMLHGMGFFHFDQIATWSAAELAWVDQHLTGFKGRASRDNWVAQARTLAGGGETEFSRRVEDGDIY